MSISTMEQTDVPGKLVRLESDTESDPPKTKLDYEPGFRSFLTLGIITSRGLRTYCTPCQARGATF